MRWSLVFETLRFELVSNFLRYVLVAAPFFVVFWVGDPWPARRYGTGVIGASAIGTLNGSHQITSQL